MLLFLKFILAHLIGDFLLQPDSWVKAKEEKKLKAYQLYLHVIIHWTLLMVLVRDWNFLPWACLLAGIHFIIDAIKLIAQTANNKRALFFTDQALHFLSLYAVFCWYADCKITTDFLMSPNTLLFMISLLFLTTPSSVAIRFFIARWSPDPEGKEMESLQSAGKYIGILERLFVFAFVIMNHWEAIGFLIAAKSVFRFGDLKESRNRKLTEYVLIGTFISFGIAIVVGIIYESLLIK